MSDTGLRPRLRSRSRTFAAATAEWFFRSARGASHQVEFLTALASDQGFKARRRTLHFAEAVRIFIHLEFRILGDACISSGAAIGTYDFKHGSITRHGCEISANPVSYTHLRAHETR